MRARWIKPEFFRDRKIGGLGPVPALVYIALWCAADDEGGALCDTDRLKGDLFLTWPDIPESAITEALNSLEGAGRIRRYRVGDDTYALIPNFTKHQGKIHKKSSWTYPRPDPKDSGTTPALHPERSGTPHILTSSVPSILASSVPRKSMASDDAEPVVIRLPETDAPEDSGGRPPKGNGGWLDPFLAAISARGVAPDDREVGKMRSMAKKLIDEHGYNVTLAAFEGFLHDWTGNTVPGFHHFKQNFPRLKAQWAVEATEHLEAYGEADPRSWQPKQPTWPDGWQRRDGDGGQAA